MRQSWFACASFRQRHPNGIGRSLVRLTDQQGPAHQSRRCGTRARDGFQDVDIPSAKFADDHATQTVDVAIVGGGASGVLAAIHLLANAHPPASLALVESAEGLANGVAYSTAYPEHLLNVTAGRMSAFERRPGHFNDFVARAMSATAASVADRFCERRLYARYLRETLDDVRAKADLRTMRDRVVGLDFPDTSAHAQIALQSGRTLHARVVVLATGNFPRALPLPQQSIDRGVRVDDAWNFDAIRGIDPASDVAIIGSGLSMVDTAMSLVESGHRGLIHVLSRHGLSPLPHASSSRRAPPDDLHSDSLPTLMRSIRRSARHHMDAGEPWQYAMDALRPFGQSLWLAMRSDEQARFMRHAARYWDIHRHRIAPEAHEKLERLRQRGQLHVHAGRLVSLRDVASRIQVRHVPRGDSAEQILVVDRIVNGTGLQMDLRRVADPLLAHLFLHGTACAGPQGLGLRTDPAGRLVAATGETNPRLFTLGSTRVGQLWESIAIPELRVQAEDLAIAIDLQLTHR
jgi:uncharacterized NAD(P)/FAD-binding protein YdhS